MKKTTSKHKKETRKKVLLTLAGVAAVVLVLWGLDKANVINLPFLSDDTSSQSTGDGSGIKYEPATEEEKKETEAYKDSLDSGGNTSQPTPPGQKKSVTPVITSWGQNQSNDNVEATGYVGGIFENGGTCTLTAKMGDNQVSESAPATPNAQNVSCGLITIARSKLSAGTWGLTLSYSSANAEGTSGSQPLEVK